jgi:hypothetical protein
MYFIRKIKKTKKKLDKSSFIISLPKKLQRKIESQNKEIENRLANFSRFHYFYDVTEGSRCFLLSLWNNELPPNSIHDKTVTTTIQRSGRSSRYMLIPRKVCNRYGWGMDTELVIGLDDQLDEFVHDTIYKNNDFVTDKERQPQVYVIKFQRYQDMKEIYKIRLAKKKEELARQESDAYWNTRNRSFNYDIIMDRINYARKHIRRLVWNHLLQMNLVVVSYSDFVKLRATMERERKKKRRQFLQKRYGNRTTWSYRKDFVKRGRKYGYDYDSYYENKLDDPDSYLENRLDNPDSYHEDKISNTDD